MLVRGQYTFGEDPFTFTSRGAYWANHAWLFDLGLYGLYSLPHGGAVVVAVKAALMAGLAVVLLATARRPGASLWLPACFALLAILAASPRFYLQPACLSMLLLAVVIWLLRRPLVFEGVDPRSWWLLPPLCALWVNLDQWFLLGPLAVGLFLLGGFLQRRHGPATDGRGGALRTGFAAAEFRVPRLCLGACLLSPHHYHALRLPEHLGFGQAAQVLSEDLPVQERLSAPPGISRASTIDPSVGLECCRAHVFSAPAAVRRVVSGQSSWFPLVAALLTLAVAVLSGMHSRAIPFFAIVAGPVTAAELHGIRGPAFRCPGGLE